MGAGGRGRGRGREEGDTSWSTNSLQVTTDFPILSSTQFATLNRVINALPPNASSWAAFNDCYRSLGIDDDQDEAYSLFLKLSLETGTTWREKWAAAKSSLAARGVVFVDQKKATRQSGETAGSGGGRPTAKGSGAGTFDLLKAKVDKVTSARPAARPSKIPSSAPARPSPTPTRDFLVKPTHGHSSSDDYVGVPSSSRFRLPDPPPARQSSRATNTPATTTKRDSVHAPPSSNQPRRLPTSSEPPPIRTSSPTAPYDSLRLPTELEAQADNFRRFSLLSFAWYNWRVRRATVLSREANLDQARRKVLLRWTLGLWRKKLERTRRLEIVCEQVLVRRREELMEKVMKSWVKRVDHRKRERWEVRLKEAWELVRARVKTRIKREALQYWLSATLETRATRFRRASLLAPTFLTWTNKYNHLIDLREQADDLALQRQESDAKQLLQRWRQAAELKFLERHRKSSTDEIVLRNCFKYWKQRATKSRERRRTEEVARQFRVLRQKKTALRHWQHRYAHTQVLLAQSDAFLQKRSRAQLSLYLHYWLTACSGSLLLQARGVRLARKCLATWITRYHHIAINLEGRAIAFSARSSDDIKYSVMSQWIEVLDTRIDASEYAASVDRQRVLSGCWKKWKERKERAEVWEAKAEVANGFFVQRRAWNKWVERVARRKVERWEEGLRLKRKRDAFGEWLAATRRAKTAQVLVESFQGAVNTRLLSNALTQWTHKLVELRSREFEVQATYESALVRSTFDKWARVCLRHGERYSLVESFQLVKDQELATKVFRNWLRSTRKIVELRRRLDDYTGQKNVDTLRDAFSKWRELSLRRKEEEVVAMRQARVLASAWDLWVKRTKSLPAIQFDKKTTCRKFFDRWREQVTDPALVKEATGWDHLTTTGHCLNIWQARFQARAAMRSVNRFRHFGSPGSGQVASTSTPHRAGARNTLLTSPNAPPIPSQPSPSSSPRPVLRPLSLRSPPASSPVSPPSPSPEVQPTSPVPSSSLWSRPSSASGEFRPRLSSEYSRSESGRSEERGGRDSGMRARLRAAAMASKSS